MSSDYVKILTAAGMIEAEILRGLLEARDIEVVLRRESAGAAIGIGAGPLGAVDLLVPSHLEQRAQSLLDDYYSGRIDPDELAPDQG